MKIGVIGLGRMGKAITHRLINAGHDVIGFDPNQESRAAANQIGASIVTSLDELNNKVHIFWLMLPAGNVVDSVLDSLQPLLQHNDIIIDGGNSHFKDSIRHADQLKNKGIHFLDCGVSGGLKGEEIGFSLMIGGNYDVFSSIIPLFQAIAAPNGYAFMGESGAGHYVKMVHNGIEYAILQAYGEGFHLLREGHYKNLDLAQVADVWAHGSVIRSWIVELCQEVLAQDQHLQSISGKIGENLTGRWTLQEAEDHNISTKLIKDALDIRSWSRETGGNFATKMVAMLRNKFGGHLVEKKR